MTLAGVEKTGNEYYPGMNRDEQYNEDRKLEEHVFAYLDEISRYRLLTRDEEIELSRKVISEDYSEEERNAARQKLYDSNLRLVVSIAKEYKTTHLSLMDRIQEGNMGLLKAIEKYNPELGWKFSTYASYWIRQKITRLMIDREDMIRKPVYAAENLHKYKKAFESLSNELGRNATDEELHALLHKEGWKENNINRAAEMYRSTIISMEDKLNENSNLTFNDAIMHNETEIPSDYAETIIDNEELRISINKFLNEREQKIIIMRFGLADGIYHTLEDVAKVFGLTRERIRQIEVKSKNKLRENMNNPFRI